MGQWCDAMVDYMLSMSTINSSMSGNICQHDCKRKYEAKHNIGEITHLIDTGINYSTRLHMGSHCAAFLAHSQL